jgi:hypothetical protein
VRHNIAEGHSSEIFAGMVSTNSLQKNQTRQHTMNTKQKILTIVALAAFSVIIFFHYYAPWYDAGERWTEYMTASEKKEAVKKGYKVTVIPLPKLDLTPVDPDKPSINGHGTFTEEEIADDSKPSPPAKPHKGFTDEEVELKPVKKTDIFDKLENVTVERRGIGYCLTDMHPLIWDVRMPLFVLAVFYAGLFFVLRTERKP